MVDTYEHVKMPKVPYRLTRDFLCQFIDMYNNNKYHCCRLYRYRRQVGQLELLIIAGVTATLQPGLVLSCCRRRRRLGFNSISL